MGVVEDAVAIYRSFTRTSGQTSSNRTHMCRATAQVLEQGLQLSPLTRGAREEASRAATALLRQALVDARLRNSSRTLRRRLSVCCQQLRDRAEPSSRPAYPYTLTLVLQAIRGGQGGLAS